MLGGFPAWSREKEHKLSNMSMLVPPVIGLWLNFVQGWGGISLGAQAACVHTCLFVDKSPLSVEVLQMNKGAQVLQADIMQRSTQQQVHMLSPAFPVLLSAGFPCQPYSRQGSGLALQDPRSDVLKGVLRTAWLMQCAGLILECVSEVAQHPTILRSIEELASKLGMRAQSTVLDLKDQWIARRKRWWSVILPQGQSKLQLLPWPVSDGPKAIGELIQAWPIWEEEEERELLLTQQEKAKFEDPRYGTDNRRLDMAQPAPTALHSYGNALAACPCGCRNQGFSEARLLRDGLRGFAVVSARLGCLRHIHPHELGFLNGVHASFVFPKSPRAALSLIGQIASPLQSLWIFLHVANWAAREKGLPPPPGAAQVLEVFKSRLLHQQSVTWIVPAMLSPRQLKVSDAKGAFEVKVSRPTRACDIVEAHAKLQHFEASFQVYVNGQPLDPEDYIPASVQAVEIKWTPVARELALPIASPPLCISSQATYAGTEPTSSRKRTFQAAEGLQVDRVGHPNPCLFTPQAYPGQTLKCASPPLSWFGEGEPCKTHLPEGFADPQADKQVSSPRVGDPNPCLANPNPCSGQFLTGTGL